MSNDLLSLSDCEFLFQLDSHGTLSAMALALNQDKSYLSRRATKISSIAPVLIRVQTKWALTEQGKQIILWYKDAIGSQQQILKGKTEICIGTTQTISERKLTALIPSIQNEMGIKGFKISSESGDYEKALLAGGIDFALVCSIPENPELRYKKIFKASYAVVIPFQWKDSIKSVSDLFELPYVSHSAIDMRKMMNFENSIDAPIAKFDHLVGVREGVCCGLGWALLPSYAIEREISDKKMKISKFQPVTIKEEFQLWWLPGKQDKKMVQTMIEILTKSLS